MPNYFAKNPGPLVIADFDYFRIPRPKWPLMLARLAQLGVDGLALHLPWGFHEIEAGTIDLQGVSNARRDVKGLLALAARLDFPCWLNLSPAGQAGLLGQGWPAWLLKLATDQPGERPAGLRRWLKSLSDELADFQWPAGPVVALQLDQEALAESPPTLDPQLTEVKWPIWLRKQYGSIEALNEAYGTNYPTVSRVTFPENWAEGGSPLAQEAQAFLAEQEVELEPDFSRLLRDNGWQIPIYTSDSEAGLPAIQTQSLLEPEPVTLPAKKKVILRLQHPIQVDPEPVEVGEGLVWANNAPIRADGSLRRKFWQVRQVLWAQRFKKVSRQEPAVLVSLPGGLLISTAADTQLNYETTAPARTPLYRLAVSGELERDETVRLSRKKLSGLLLAETASGQTDLALLLDQPGQPLAEFNLIYFKRLLIGQAESLKYGAGLAEALAEMLALPLDEPVEPARRESVAAPKKSYILAEARRGLSEADAALRKALASIGGLERGFATILGPEEPAGAQPAPGPVAINPLVFSGSAQAVLLAAGTTCREISGQLATAAGELEALIERPAGFSLAQYQQAYQTAIGAAQLAGQPLAATIAELRLKIASEELPLVIWRVHDQLQHLAESLRWGVLRA